MSGTGAAFQVPVYIDIPDELPPTPLHPKDDRILWRLEITSAVKGIDYASRFEVPIYKKMETAKAGSDI